MKCQILFSGKNKKDITNLSSAKYGKCPKNSNTKVSDKMTYTNSVDPDQTAPSGAVIRVYTVCHSTKYLKKLLHKKTKFKPKEYGIKCSKF